jgi:hypothetical protein
MIADTAAAPASGTCGFVANRLLDLRHLAANAMHEHLSPDAGGDPPIAAQVENAVVRLMCG